MNLYHSAGFYSQVQLLYKHCKKQPSIIKMKGVTKLLQTEAYHVIQYRVAVVFSGVLLYLMLLVVFIADLV